MSLCSPPCCCHFSLSRAGQLCSAFIDSRRSGCRPAPAGLGLDRAAQHHRQLTANKDASCIQLPRSIVITGSGKQETQDEFNAHYHRQGARQNRSPRPGKSHHLKGSICKSIPARHWRWSARPVPASPPCSACWPASTCRAAARSRSSVSPRPGWTRRRADCAPIRWASCSSPSCCCPP